MDESDYHSTPRMLVSEIRADLFRYASATRLRDFVWTYLRVPGFRYSLWLRITHWCWHRGGLVAAPVYLVGRLLMAHFAYKLGYQICHTTTIRPGLHLGHFGPVIVNGNASIGHNVNLSVGVVVGRTNRGRKQGTPTIEDNVWIGTNAVVVGRITVGENALIAPGAYVNFDVPANAVVLGNPGRIVSMQGSAEYVNNKWAIDDTHGKTSLRPRQAAS